ncbi:MAG: DUF4153 domain-containing protein [Saccharofermentanales bacterium]
MKPVFRSIANVFKRGGLAFVHYPVSMLFAICLAVLSIWIIAAEPNINLKLLHSLQWTFAFGTFFGMALSVIAKKASAKQITFILTNIIAIIISGVAFIAVFYSKGNDVSSDSITRILAGIVISYLVFLIVPTYRGRKINYNEMVFMVIKSFFVAAVYSLVIMLGFFFVAFAVQSLIYKDLSSKIYSYIAILSGLLGYSFFLGYFPEFKDEEEADDEKIEALIKQPRFAEIIFQNIMIPIFAALTVVLIIWCFRILLTWEWPDFNQIIGIFSAYSLVGILLYYLVSSYSNLISRLYKKIIPITTLVFLGFEAYPIYNQINLYGVKPLEYAIVFLWIFAVITSILFLFLPIVKNRIPSYIAIVLIAVIVMPGIGATDLSFTLQANRLESLLNKNGMLVNGEIRPGSNVDKKDRQDMTDATLYLFRQENKTAPQWVTKSLPTTDNFESVFGFPQEFYSGGNFPGTNTKYISLRIDNTPVSLEDYKFYIPKSILDYTGSKQAVVITTEKGDYRLTYDTNPGNKDANFIPKIDITFNGENVLSSTLDAFADTLKTRYVTASGAITQGEQMIPLSEMSYVITGSKAAVKLVFQNVSFTVDAGSVVSQTFEIQGIYFKELA